MKIDSRRCPTHAGAVNPTLKAWHGAVVWGLALAGGLSAGTAALALDLEPSFHTPPRSAQPWAYYFIMDGHLTREGITADFEAMTHAGLGGMIVMEVDAGIPRGPVEFMSPAWRKLFAHAVTEAERLGLQITLNAGPGWTGSGGPWVKPEQSMQHLVAAAVEVTGPARFDALLPRPKPREPYFGNGGLPADLVQAKDAFYADVAVLAVPTPRDAARLTDVEEKALYLRHPYSSRPGTKPFLAAPAHHTVAPPDAVIPAARVLDLTGRLDPAGRLSWEVPEGAWTLLRFGRTSTGANTRPAPAPGLGLECDKFDPAALEAHFDAFVGTLLRELGPRPRPADAGWTMLHIDSWEMGAQNWTATFRDEFRRRRGYDPLPYLPVVTGRIVDSLEGSERFLWDWRQTAQELVLAHHAHHLKALGRRHGFGLSIEPYDMNPCADLSLGAVADVPMCEFWLYGFHTWYSVLEAVSSAHTTGRPIVAAEAFTSDDTERWQAHPASMKTLGDWAFSAGVNRLVFHRYQHQPAVRDRPGMTMGPYGVHWERTQTWWDLVPAYHTYLARCQFLLRQGLPVADVCFLSAEGAPHVFHPPATATDGTPPDRRGYGFDGCAPDTFLARADVRDGRLVFPDGMSYRVLVLPERDTMTPALLRKLKQLVEAGLTIIGPRPEKSPSLSGYPQCDTEVQRLADELWGSAEAPPSAGAAAAEAPGPAPVRERRVGQGRVVWRPGLTRQGVPEPAPASPEQYGDFAVVTRLLEQMGVAPDFESDGPLRYAHRQVGETELYFVANREARAVDARCTFRVAGRTPELWDPLTGATRVLPEFTEAGGRTTVPLRFEPAQSWFVVFRHPLTGPRPAGRNFPALEALGELTGPWDVAFDAAWGGPASVTFPRLEDWSQRPEPGLRFYSGAATYRKQFDLPAFQRSDVNRQRSEVRPHFLLDLGTVRDLAQVRLNGIDLGVVWCAPWRVDIADAVQPTGNRLEIVVANRWPNRLIGDAALPADQRRTRTTWSPFKPEAPLLPSGLLGPVTLHAPLPPTPR